ncbi:helix-turn-helix domain-containing protein [Nonomuraea sp. NPDC049695]|uniref:helix-turn-helix domain-containing protein n=1 Tax=Nonomuraea sp. NPDC049695 TaxID=3154734 RepID=UPI0034147E7E
MPLAARLKRLREIMVNPRTGTPYSLREAAAAISAAGTPITDAYLSLLETGDRRAVSLEKAIGIARFYGVPVEYLQEEPHTEIRDDVESRLALFEAILRAGAAQTWLRRAMELSPEGRRRIARLIEQERRDEGLLFDSDG